MTLFKPGLTAVSPSKMLLNTMYHFARAGKTCTVVRRENGVYTWAEMGSADVGMGGTRELTEWSSDGVKNLHPHAISASMNEERSPTVYSALGGRGAAYTAQDLIMGLDNVNIKRSSLGDFQ